MPNRILIDTSFLYSLYDKDDKRHALSKAFADSTASIILVPDVILVEATYLFNQAGGIPAVLRFFDSFANRKVQLQPIAAEDIGRVRDIMARYTSAKLDFVDCCIMALAERLNITQVCTFDRRDFSIFRPTHCDFLELLP